MELHFFLEEGLHMDLINTNNVLIVSWYALICDFSTGIRRSAWTLNNKEKHLPNFFFNSIDNLSIVHRNTTSWRDMEMWNPPSTLIPFRTQWAIPLWNNLKPLLPPSSTFLLLTLFAATPATNSLSSRQTYRITDKLMLHLHIQMLHCNVTFSLGWG